jgi:uncharacterized lipoprotein YajG
MKKYILPIFVLLFTFSCASQGKKIKLDSAINFKSSTIGANKEIDVVVIDDRQDKENIGVKKFGEEKIYIKSEQNLTNVLKDEILSGLFQNGFKLGKGKLMEVHIESFYYTAKRGIIGKSKAKSILRIEVKNKKSGEKLIKNFSVISKGNHFVMPLESTDNAKINWLLKEVIADIFKDKNFLENLAK